MTGFGLGAAIRGLRPIHIHIRVDFMILATNQLINMVSNYTTRQAASSRCRWSCAPSSSRWGQGAQHSKSLFSNFTHIPGLEGHRADHAVGHEGHADRGHPRRQSGDLLRAPLAVLGRGRARGAVRDPARRRAHPAAGQGRHGRRPVVDERRGAGRHPRQARRVDRDRRSTHAGAASRT